MTIANPTALLEEVTDFLASSPTAAQIISFSPSTILEERARDLLQRNHENLLTIEEREEMEEFMRIEHFMTLLKVKARLNLANQE